MSTRRTGNARGCWSSDGAATGKPAQKASRVRKGHEDRARTCLASPWRDSSPARPSSVLAAGRASPPADVEACRGKTRVIAVNDAYRLAPFADVLYACDEKWWKWHQGVPSFTGLKYGMAIRPGKYPDVQRLHGYRRRGTGTRADRAPHRPQRRVSGDQSGRASRRRTDSPARV
jgi:hypothetical protein